MIIFTSSLVLTIQVPNSFVTKQEQTTVNNETHPLSFFRYNVCIMAYGQTGSGKTHTMFGPLSGDNFIFSTEDEPELGIIPRATEEVFRYW